MKKVIGIVLVASMLLCIISFSFAQEPLETSKMVSVTLEVGSTFGMRILSSEYDQTLKPLSEVEDEREGEIHIYVSTNRGRPWSIGAACSEFSGASQTGYGISLVMSTSGGKGRTVNGLELKKSGQAIYTSGISEYSVRDLLVHSLFKVKDEIAPFLKEGTYTGYITLTMTEVAPPR